MPIVIIAVLKPHRIPIAAKTAESFLPSRWKKFSFVILNFKIWRLFWCYAHDRTF